MLLLYSMKHSNIEMANNSFSELCIALCILLSVPGRNVCFWREDKYIRWKDAFLACERKGGTLAKILSSEENDMVRSMRLV